MNRWNGWKMAWVVFLFCAAAAIGSPAQTFTSLVSFNGANGANPQSVSLVQGINGNLYGTTSSGGANGDGTVFEITPAGALTTLYSFCSQTNCTDGKSPYAGVVLATNGNFYGTTQMGGANGRGTIFKITAAGTLTTVYSFCSQTNCTDGYYPLAALVLATNGNLYGTTSGGGATFYGGTVFEITPGGKLTTLYSFCSQTNCADGEFPLSGLVRATNGNFYGTTNESGAIGGGTVFEITPGGKLTTLHNFCSQTNCSDGQSPSAGLVQAGNGNFYGTTNGGGAIGGGTVFEITPGGKLTTLHSFARTDGAVPYAGLVQATNGNFWGTTEIGGANGTGTIFEITGGGNLTTLHNFVVASGSHPYGGLVQATNGTLYGTTTYGGSSNTCKPPNFRCGTVFSLDVRLRAFVETQPTSGKVGANVIILGNDLTGTSSVSFNGTAATFRFASSTEIKTTVPPGATTGAVEVITPNGTLKSNVVFRVTP